MVLQHGATVGQLDAGDSDEDEDAATQHSGTQDELHRLTVDMSPFLAALRAHSAALFRLHEDVYVCRMGFA